MIYEQAPRVKDVMVPRLGRESLASHRPQVKLRVTEFSLKGIDRQHKKPRVWHFIREWYLADKNCSLRAELVRANRFWKKVPGYKSFSVLFFCHRREPHRTGSRYAVVTGRNAYCMRTAYHPQKQPGENFP